MDPSEQMVMVIKAPPETQLQVSDPAEVSWNHPLLPMSAQPSAKPSPGSASTFVPPQLTPLPFPQAFQVSVRSTQGPIDVFLCPEDSSGVCSPVKSPFKAPIEESSPSHPQPRASPLLHPAQDMNMPLLPGEQGGQPGLEMGGTWGRGCWCDVTGALADFAAVSPFAIGTSEELE